MHVKMRGVFDKITATYAFCIDDDYCSFFGRGGRREREVHEISKVSFFDISKFYIFAHSVFLVKI